MPRWVIRKLSVTFAKIFANTSLLAASFGSLPNGATSSLGVGMELPWLLVAYQLHRPQPPNLSPLLP
jgi:hypothetical protein